jgi:hypothetical protein
MSERKEDIIVDYFFGAEDVVNNFIMTKNYLVVQTAKRLGTLKNVIDFNYNSIRYPLDCFGNPLTTGRLSYAKYLLSWLFNKTQGYIWQYPNMVLLSKLGVCIDTSNLMTSLLRVLNKDAYTTLGEVRLSQSNELLGYHAWALLKGPDQDQVIETTIHKGQGDYSQIVLNKDAAYSGKLRLKYVPYLHYNETMTIKDNIELLRITLFGENSRFKSLKEFLKAEKQKQKAIWKKV